MTAAAWSKGAPRSCSTPAVSAKHGHEARAGHRRQWRHRRRDLPAPRRRRSSRHRPCQPQPKPEADAIVGEILAAGGSGEAVAFDVTDRVATAAALAALLDKGAIQILVNNAGIHADAVFPGMSGEQWDSVVDVSLNGFFNVTQPLTLPMIRTRWGRIITISSVAGITGNRGQVNYSAAKGALHAASKALALELASRGITVNAVAPGIIATGMSEAPSTPRRSRRWCRCSAPASRKRSPTSSPSWHRIRPPTSPGRSSRSTAA
jgi:NAD(P)-dependent dehydrogenase (short-subunit alcohol dehydrogenase family)